jgi:acetaldehyde dehydrogenase/alcohol dehydrogenase
VRDPVPDDELKNLKLTLQNAVVAQRTYSTYTQSQVDAIFKAAAAAACAQRIPLAIIAVEETKMGVVEDKVDELL